MFIVDKNIWQALLDQHYNLSHWFLLHRTISATLLSLSITHTLILPSWLTLLYWPKCPGDSHEPRSPLDFVFPVPIGIWHTLTTLLLRKLWMSRSSLGLSLFLHYLLMLCIYLYFNTTSTVLALLPHSKMILGLCVEFACSPVFA